MKTKHEITLRPVSNGGDKRRLGLYTAEFKQYVQDQTIKAVYADLGDGAKDISAMKTYSHGSITSPNVNAWLHQHGWLTPDHQLLFSLEVDISRLTHTYRFVKHL